MAAAYHKLHCTHCKREMVISFDTLQLVVPHEIMKQPKDPEHPDMFFLWKGDYCFQCNPEKIGKQLEKQNKAEEAGIPIPHRAWGEMGLNIKH